MFPGACARRQCGTSVKMEPPAGIVPATHCPPHVRNEILKEGETARAESRPGRRWNAARAQGPRPPSRGGGGIRTRVLGVMSAAGTT